MNPKVEVSGKFIPRLMFSNTRKTIESCMTFSILAEPTINFYIYRTPQINLRLFGLYWCNLDSGFTLCWIIPN